MSSASIEFDQISKRFERDRIAVERVTLTIGAGQFVSLVGPSGCGKTTLLRLIAGLERPSAGRLSVRAGAEDGGDPRAPPPMSYVFQEPTLMPWANVFDNAWLPLRIRGVSRARARPGIEAALAAVGLTGFERAYPDQLSGGMKMRVSIARASITRPQVLLLDEPFAALDELTRQRHDDDLLSLWAARRPTTIFVTHSVSEAVYLSERVIVLGGRPGQVRADLAIDLPRPRPRGLRTTPEFARACREVEQALEADFSAGAPSAAVWTAA
ncbi:MAG TPA: ABC transporter ATP-binding protein [Burkholderiaceae bacterium]